MKKHVCLLAFLFLTTMVSAQTQYGYVKTKGRSVNGKYIHGEGLPGTLVSIENLTPIRVKTDDGCFDFPVPKDMKYHIYSVERKDYQILDLSELRPKTYSGDTIFLIMVKPDQQQADLLAKERNLRRNSEKRLQKLEDSIQNLNISLEEKNRQLEGVNQERELNEKYIKELAKYYATLDYDRISEFQRQIDALLEEGELKKARQLLYSKGNIVNRLEEIRIEEQAEAQMDAEIQMSIETNNQAKSGTSSKKQELAQNCYSFFHSYLLEQRYDSASYYIEFRANIDSTNAKWQYDAASYFGDQHFYGKAEMYYLKALNGYLKVYDENKFKIGIIKNDLAKIYDNTKRIDESEVLYKEALDVFIGLDSTYIEEGVDDFDKEMGIVMVYMNLSSLYFQTDTTRSKAELLMVKALDILKESQDEEKREMMPFLLSYLGDMYHRTGQEYERTITTAVETARQLAINDTSYYGIMGVVLVSSSSSYVFGYLRSNDLDLLVKAETLALESLEAFRLHEYYNQEDMELNIASARQILAFIYLYSQRFQESEAQFVDALEIYRRNAKHNPIKYNEELCNTMMGLASTYKELGQYDKSESLFKEALELPFNMTPTDEKALAQIEIAELKIIQNQPQEATSYFIDAINNYKCLEKESPQEYAHSLAQTLADLGELYGSMQQPDSSILNYTKAVEIYRRLAENNHQDYELRLAGMLNNLGNQYKSVEQYDESKNAYTQAVEIYRRYLDNGQLLEYGIDHQEAKLALTLKNLGELYSLMQRFGESIVTYTEAVGIYRRLVKDNPQDYELYLAGVLVNLGNQCDSDGRFKDGESAYDEAAEIYRRLADEPNLASTLFNLGLLYSHAGCSNESVNAYKMSLEIYRRLADRNPLVYEKELVNTLNNLGLLYLRDSETFLDSKDVLEEALVLCRKMTESDAKNNSLLAMVLENLGLLSVNMLQYAQAILFIEEVRELYQELALQDSFYQIRYLSMLYFSIQPYCETNNYEKCYETCEELIPVLKQNKDNIESWEEVYVNTLGTQSVQAIYLGKYAEAEKQAVEALNTDLSQQWIFSSLAASLLFQGKFNDAEEIYCHMKSELKDRFLQDLNDFESAGAIPKERIDDVEVIRKMLLE